MWIMRPIQVFVSQHRPVSPCIKIPRVGLSLYSEADPTSLRAQKRVSPLAVAVLSHRIEDFLYDPWSPDVIHLHRKCITEPLVVNRFAGLRRHSEPEYLVLHILNDHRRQFNPYFNRELAPMILQLPPVDALQRKTTVLLKGRREALPVDRKLQEL
jgi:hypothetical protein